MFVISGYREKPIITKELPDHECTKCKTKGITLEATSKYFHLYWIPVFSYAKSGRLKCDFCKNETKEKEMPLEYRPALEFMKKETRLPIRHFSGLIIIGLFAGLITYFIQSSNAKVRGYMKNPQVGDIYVTRDNTQSEVSYGFMRVIGVKADTMEMLLFDNYYGSTYDLEQDIKLINLDDTDYYFSLHYFYTIDEMRVKFKTDEIWDVLRLGEE